MSTFENELGQPIGPPLPTWSARPPPRRVTLEGRTVRLEPLDPGKHASALFAAFAEGRAGWTYLAYGPFASEDDFRAWVEGAAAKNDPLFFTIVDSAAPVGLAAFQRIEPASGVVEVGNVHFGPRLARGTSATEAMFLMMRHAFDELGYRRYEWKCDTLNAKSRAAAERLGFRFEGVFRHAMVYKGRSRDTAWYSVIDSEWPALKARFERWLSAANFDAAGRQRVRLHDI